MRAKDYHLLGQLLRADCDEAIREFAQSRENREVYAFSIYCDPDNGGYNICLNTEGAFRHTVQERYPEYPEQQLTGFRGVKFNPPDFVFFDVHPTSAALQAACSRYRAYLDTLAPEGRAVARHIDRFVEQAVLAIGQLDDAFALLDRTGDFIAYVSLHDAAEPTQVALCRRTVTADLFARVFPDVVEREQLKEHLAQEPIDMQVAFWAREVEARALLPVGRHRTSADDEHDALEALQALGQSAVPAILDLIERHAGHRELTVPGSQEFSESGAFTSEAWLTHLLLMALIDIGHADDTVHHRLVRLLRDVYAANRAATKSGLNPSLAARALHRLFPKRYPPPEVSPRTNHLLNAHAFGIE